MSGGGELAILAAGAAALFIASRSRARAADRRTPAAASRIALIGDSLAVGLGPLLGKLAQADGVVFQHEGHVGTRARQWATHAAACGHCGDWLDSMRPTLALVSLGTNDVASSMTAEAPFYAQIRDRIRALGASVLWLAPPRIERAGLVAVRKVIDGLGVTTFHTELLTIPLGPDGIHPTAAGYSAWADAIWRYLREQRVRTSSAA